MMMVMTMTLDELWADVRHFRRRTSGEEEAKTTVKAATVRRRAPRRIVVRL